MWPTPRLETVRQRQTKNANLSNVNHFKPSSNYVVADENTNAKQFTRKEKSIS